MAVPDHREHPAARAAAQAPGAARLHAPLTFIKARARRGG
jgi:hypothetical protein